MNVRRPALPELLHTFVDELRGRGLPISMIERIDAMRAVQVAELGTRHGLHAALAATLVKSGEHRIVFDEVFDLFFRKQRNVVSRELPEGEQGTSAPTRVPVDLDHALRTYLRDGSEILAQIIAEQAVADFAHFVPGRPMAGVLYQKRTVEGLRLDAVVEEVARQETTLSLAAGRVVPVTRQTIRLHRVEDRAEQMRRHIQEVVREMLVADRGVQAVAKTLRMPLPMDIVIAMASQGQLVEIDRAVRLLQHKLTQTLIRKQRTANGSLNVRATLRASMASGGVPLRLVYRRPRPTRPQLFVLADMSGSVATFAAFTVALVCAMGRLFSRLRSFAFISNTVEVTELFRDVQDPFRAVEAVNAIDGLNFYDGHTDYGRSLNQFWKATAPELGPRTTVLIFGDARNNYQTSGQDALARVGKRSRSVYWLNPEPVSLWDTGDSQMAEYAQHCTAALSCQTLGDLTRFIERLPT